MVCTLTLVSHVLFAAAHVNEIEEQFVVKSFCKSFKYSGIVDNARLAQCIAQARDVGVYSSDDLWRRQVRKLSGDKLVDGSPNEIGCLLATFLSLLNEIVVEDHSISVKQDDNERVSVLWIISMQRECNCIEVVPLRTELFSADPATESLAAVVHDYNVSRVRDQAELVQGASRSRQVDKAYPAQLVISLIF